MSLENYVSRTSNESIFKTILVTRVRAYLKHKQPHQDSYGHGFIVLDQVYHSLVAPLIKKKPPISLVIYITNSTFNAIYFYT